VGKVVGTHGLKGLLKVLPLTDFPERFDVGKHVSIKGREYEITQSQWHNRQVRLGLKDIGTIELAEGLVGSEVTVDDSDAPELEEGEYLVADLIGLEVVDVSGRKLGTVDEVIDGAAHDVYRVGHALVPAVKEFIKSIDLAGGRMTVAPIPGMFDED
jgi:16S rRNA processing protein RimM